MTASDILNLCVTVAVVQAGCDLVAYWRVYRTEAYERALEKQSRAAFRKDKAQKELEQAKQKEDTSGATTAKDGNKKPSSKAMRLAKTAERAEQDMNDASANVARFGILPGFMTSMVFVVLMRVLGTEHQGKIMGLLPFVPFRFVHRITGRGLDFGAATVLLESADEDKMPDVRHVWQGFSFVFCYFLAGLSIKFYVSRILGNRPPGGDSNILSLTQSTWGKQFLRAAGVDPDELKME
eukprot:scaffold1139_cov174-Amphora_coffeaeformis.AAC.2